MASVLVLHAPSVPAPPPLQGTWTASRVGLRLVHSWCFCSDLVWEWNSSDSLCYWHLLHSVSSAPVLRFSGSPLRSEYVYSRCCSISSASMNMAQIQCPSCKRIFSHSGYSQHVSKTQRADCRAVHLLGHSYFQTGPAAASQPLVNLGPSPDTLFTTAHSPADHGMIMFGHLGEPDFAAPQSIVNS